MEEIENKPKKESSRFLNYFFIFCGLVMVILGSMAIFESIFLNNSPNQILWVCYIGVILTGIAVLLKNSYLLNSQINILLIPLTIWNLDFFYIVFFRKSLFGITDYFFNRHKYPISVIINSQHLFILPLSILALYFLKIKRRDSWKLSLIQITLLFMAVRLFIPFEKNINYSFAPVDFIFLRNIPQLIYPLFWFLIFFIMIYFSNMLLLKICRKKL